MLVAAVVTFASLLAQAEPAPPANAVSVFGRFAYRIGDPGQTLPPAGGFSLGGSIERRYLSLPHALELGAAIDFFYDRFAMDVIGSTLDQNGNPVAAPGTRAFTHTNFAVLQAAALALDSIRPFVAFGGGVDIGYFSTPEPALAPGSQSAVMPLVRGVLGIEVPIGNGVAVVVRADYTHLFSRPSYTPSLPGGGGTSPTISFWGDLFDAGAGVAAHF
jgi:hypothetical protein